uniref:uncharacterized protein LOC122591444 n=1 Tax=Erigeron canadensis TaxID=72917 RepID=UPI001CB8DD89|nr:uncharacterized protein LOC122591444 [Erigeron canadensis]
MHDFIVDVRQENVRQENVPQEDNSNDEPMDTTDAPSSSHAPNAANDELAELLKLAETDLHPGYEGMNELDFLAQLSHVKAINKWTDTSLDQLLELLKGAFPLARLPPSTYETKKIMKKDNQDLQHYPECKASRWKDENTKGKKVANKVMCYFPLIPRLKRIYSSRYTAKDMTWHATGRCTEDGKLRHPVDGTSWKDFDSMYPVFAVEPRNVRLGLAADGFNPFGNMSTSYSMWPVILTTYNTPPWLCMKETSFMLTLLIPGPKSPGTDIDVFLRPLVDELKTLWSDGVVTKDVVTNSFFTMCAMILWTINDFPARSSLSGWSGQGYMACLTCNKDTPSEPVIGKIAYVGHRIYLDKNHKWRKDKLFNGNWETRDPPGRIANDQIWEQLSNLPTRIPCKHVGKKRKRDPKVEFNWSKRSIFSELEYWSSVQLKHNLDVMHIKKNVRESLLNTMMMHKDKSKDTDKARRVLQKWNIRPELWLVDNGRGKLSKPHPKFSFTNADRSLFCQFIKGVKLPDGFGSNFKHKVTDNDTQITGMKSHDHHIMMQRLLPIGARAYLDKNISTLIIELCQFFKQLCARNLMSSDMEDAKDKLIKILCALEQILPPSFFDIMIHLVMHLPEEAIQGGPVYMRWMYPFERYMKKLKNYVKNKARPEGSIAEGYVAEEAVTFVSRYLKGVPTRFNRLDRNQDALIPTREFYVFQSLCTPISKGVDRKLDRELWTNLNWYILNNSSEIEGYKDEFTTQMPPWTDLQTNFPNWFKQKINRQRADDESSVSNELLALANGPRLANSYTACIVNGVRLVVLSRDSHRTTQNSGVSTTGPDDTNYYGQLEDILELGYLDCYKVVLFRCKWFKTNNIKLCVTKNNITSISTQTEWFTNDQYILATQAEQVFYLNEPSKGGQRGQSNNYWKVVQEVNHRKIRDRDIVMENNDNDIIHGNTWSDFSLSADLENLSYGGLSIDKPTEVDEMDNEAYEEDTEDSEDSDEENAMDTSDDDDDDDDDLLEPNNESGVATYQTDEDD